MEETLLKILVSRIFSTASSAHSFQSSSLEIFRKIALRTSRRPSLGSKTDKPEHLLLDVGAHTSATDTFVVAAGLSLLPPPTSHPTSGAPPWEGARQEVALHLGPVTQQVTQCVCAEGKIVR